MSATRTCAPAACAPAVCAPDPTDDPLDAAELAVLFKALAHPARVQLLQHLARHGSCYFGNLSDIVELAPSTTSQHVKILKDAGLVLGSAEEQRTCYCVNTDRLAVLKRLVEAL
jgi:DNA-binding transcriptional ArsR family regulator